METSVTELVCSAKDFDRTLESLLEHAGQGFDISTTPEGIQTWKLEKLARARKLQEFMKDPDRCRNLWISVQGTLPAYHRFEILMKQGDFCNGSEVTAPWSLYTMSAPDNTNPFLQVNTFVDPLALPFI